MNKPVTHSVLSAQEVAKPIFLGVASIVLVYIRGILTQRRHFILCTASGYSG